LYWQIVDYHWSHGYAPTLRELSERIGRSLSTTQYHLCQLRDAGLVEWEPGAARTLRVADPGTVTDVTVDNETLV
jgi:hypothetical protein